MTHKAINKLKTEFKSAIDTYFGKDGMGGSDAEAVYQIFLNKLHFYEMYKEVDNFEESEMEPGVIDVDDDGLNVCYDFSSVFHSGMLETFDPIARIELLEACIYALNAKINTLESDYKKRLYGKSNDS